VANTKSAKKRAVQSAKAYDRNRWFRGRARTYIKKARSLIEAGDTAGAQESVLWACRALDVAAQKGAIHANNAARRKSRLMKALAAAA
jgi:small subunit ribosomal protein S20